MTQFSKLFPYQQSSFRTHLGQLECMFPYSRLFITIGYKLFPFTCTLTRVEVSDGLGQELSADKTHNIPKSFIQLKRKPYEIFLFPFFLQDIFYVAQTLQSFFKKGRTNLLGRFLKVIEIGPGYNYSTVRVALVKDILVCVLSSSRPIP